MGREDGKELFKVICLNAKVAKVRAGSQSDVDSVRFAGRVLLDLPVSGTAKVTEHVDDTREGLGFRKHPLLKGGVLSNVFLRGDRKLSPVVEDLVGLGAGSALKLGFDRPWKRVLAVLLQNDIDTLSVDIFSIEEEAVHVKETGPDGREISARSHCE